MTDEVRPVGPIDPRRGGQAQRGPDRRSRDRRAEGRQLVPTEPAADDPPANPPPHPAPIDPGSAIFAAQMLGQGGDKRGIRGGPPVMDKARSTYLGAEYSGSNERRPTKGEVKDEDV